MNIEERSVERSMAKSRNMSQDDNSEKRMFDQRVKPKSGIYKVKRLLIEIRRSGFCFCSDCSRRCTDKRKRKEERKSSNN